MKALDTNRSTIRKTHYRLCGPAIIFCNSEYGKSSFELYWASFYTVSYFVFIPSSSNLATEKPGTLSVGGT